EINEVRRKAAQLLTEEIVKGSRPKVEVKAIEDALKETRLVHKSKDRKLVLKTSKFDILPHLVKTRVDEIIFGGDIPLSMEQYEEAVRLCKDHNKDILLAFSSVTRKDYIEELKTHVCKLENIKPNGFLLSNYELFSLLKSTGLPLEADYKLNAFNVFTLYQLKDMGFSFAYLAQELNQGEISYICEQSPLSLGMFVHGNTELMVSQYGLLEDANKEGVLVDKLGYEFPVSTDYKNRTHIFNSKKLSLYEEIGKIKNIDKFRIDITNETMEEIRAIIEGYRDRLDGSSRIEESLKSPNPSFTKGHFRRGVE
ncbi:peptidase U32 family protein, partial [Alkalibaculum bacchi]|uniref:peptidase U32 family protein n=1 Tax=Alkalibaculum bacchi TaxID=645887 RepID=UPI0026F0AD84